MASIAASVAWVAVGVNVHLEPRPVVGPEHVRQLVGVDVPQAVLRAVVVAGPLEPGGEPLDRAVEDELDEPVPQPLVAPWDEGLDHSTPSGAGRDMPMNAGTMRSG